MNKSHINSKGLIPLLFMLFSLFTGLISSCILATNSPTESLPAQELVFPKANNYHNLVYDTNDGLIIFVDGGDMGDLQSYARENDRKFTEFDFPNDPFCHPANYYAGDVSAGGRLEIWEWCLTNHGGVQYIRTYDWKTKQLERLAGPLPLGSSGVSWNPDQTSAIIYLDSGFATRTLYWLSKDGSFSPLDLVITEGSHSWNLKDDFPDFKADDTGKTGSTGRAVWSPDGKSIAFFASPDAVGKTGFQRFGVEYYLYLMDPDNLRLSVLTEKVYSPFLIQWSPDSTHIAFIGGYGFWKEYGLWVYSLKDQSITNIAKGRFQGLAWTSNKSLAAIYCEDIGMCAQAFEYDLTSTLGL